MHISSLIVDVRPDHLDAARAALQAWPGVEIHAQTPQGKLVVSVETDTDAQNTDTFARIGAVDGVMSVALVYHQFEPDPEPEARHAIDPT